MEEERQYTFSFIDMGGEDFVRDYDGSVLKRQFLSYEEASAFVMEGGLDDLDWSNEGTRNWCWEAERDGEDVP